MVAVNLKKSTPESVLIRNVAGCSKYEGGLNIPSVHAFVREKQDYIASWEPEIFPALIITQKESEDCNRRSSKKALLYRTGRIIVTGCKTFEECHLLNEEIQDMISEKHLQDLILNG